MANDHCFHQITLVHNLAIYRLHSCPSPVFAALHSSLLYFKRIKSDQTLMRDMLNAPWLLTNRQSQWTGNGHSQLPLAELGKPSPNIDLLRTTGSNGRAFFHCLTLTFHLDLQSQASQAQGRPSCQKSRSKVKQESTHRQTDRHTHGRYQMYYLPCYVVDNNHKWWLLIKWQLTTC